jgi:aminomethyltransferase
MPMAETTPLHSRHLAAGATMVEFAGYDMPLRYTSMRDEHMAVRRHSGLFDLSHMGEVRLSGESAQATLQRLIANDVARLDQGGALYSAMCDDEGGIVDDVIAYRVEDGFLVIVNGSRRRVDVEWMRSHLTAGTELTDESDETALLAVQGPDSIAAVQPLTRIPLGALRPFRSIVGAVAGIACRISRTGYTGEDGLELYCDAGSAPSLWDALVEAGTGRGMLLAGLGARDTLRLEAGLRLYGQDMDESVDPYSCGIGWTVSRAKGDFIGSRRLLQIDPGNPPRRFVGLALGPRHIPRHGMAVRAGEELVGEVTSGGYGFTLGHGIATAYVRPDLDAEAPMSVDIRGQAAPARRVPLPFYKRPA